MTSRPKGYRGLLSVLKDRIAAARVRASVAVNQELVVLYWGIGREILARQRKDGWGSGVIERLAKDLRAAFPEMRGLSARNLGYMKAFAEAWPEAILQQAAAKLPWFHHCVLLDKVKEPLERVWYVQQAVENGWSRNVLVLQIESGLFRRQGKAVSNFARTLPAPQSDLAQQILKDPYNFDFLTLTSDARESDIERTLVDHLRGFLLELGIGFSFVGSQYPIEIAGEDYRIDLLFYHLRLRCFIVIDLKAGPFKPEYAGKMNFYLSAVDDMLKHPTDQPSVGLILCKSKKRIVVEYALRNSATPMGIADFKGSLPAIEELQAELASAADYEFARR